MASLGEMVSGLAHEVKQPLHVLRMTLFNMRQRMNSVGLDGDYLGEKLERMDAQVLRVDRLVSHLGVFSRKSALEALPFDPYAAFEGALGLLGEGLRQHAIEVECPAPTQRMVVRGQADQLEQVIINLLANARDALLGNLGLASRRIRLEQVACREPGWVELHVHDNGGGIEPLLLERIFEPFFTTKVEGKGTGLGLSVSHDLVRNMGGSLTAANQGRARCSWFACRWRRCPPRRADDVGGSAAKKTPADKQAFFSTGEAAQMNCEASQNRPADSAIEVGRVSTQAIRMLRTVPPCRPLLFATMVPATPEDSTWVVDTGRL